MARWDRHDVIPAVVAALVVAALLVWGYIALVPPAGAASEQGGHIPFTNQPVTPGDPSSYVDTVGQCPFYEMAGEKGCVPPPNLTCNADWSVCSPKDESTPVSTLNVAPVASQSVTAQKPQSCVGN